MAKALKAGGVLYLSFKHGDGERTEGGRFFSDMNETLFRALVATQPFLIDTRKTMPANNLKELVAWLKANGDKTSMGTSGVGRFLVE